VGDIDTVVVCKLDRLYRQPRELEDLIDRVEANRSIGVYAVMGGEFNLNTSDGGYSGRRSSLPTPGGGTRPFGFESDRVIVHEVRRC
jgi:hypothetical protein